MRRQCEYKKVYNPESGIRERKHIYGNTLEDNEREKRVRNHFDELVKEHEQRMLEKNNLVEETLDDNQYYSESEDEPEDDSGWTPFYKKLMRGEPIDSDHEEDELSESEPEDGEPIDSESEDDLEDGDDEDELVDMCFKEGDLKILKQMELVKPSDIEDKDINTLLNKTVYWINRLGNMKKGHAKHGDIESCDNIDFIVSILKTYRDILQPEQDQKGGRYKQNRRNAYKIGAGGRYGDLVIHVPSLLFEHVLEAFKNGRQVLKKHVDGDTIDLLTKRFNSSKPYSELSKRVFSKLNRLSGLPNHRSSMKFQFM